MKYLKYLILFTVVAAIAVALLRIIQVDGTINHYEELYEAKLDSVNKESKLRELQRDSILTLLDIRDSLNQELTNTIEALEKKVTTKNKEPILIPAKESELVDYFNSRYKTKSTELITEKIALAKQTSQSIVYDLEKGDKSLVIIDLQEEQYNLSKTLVKNLQEDKKDLSIVYTGAEKEISRRKELQQLAEGNINSLKTQNSRLQKRNNFYKYAVPASILIGGFIGFQIAK